METLFIISMIVCFIVAGIALYRVIIWERSFKKDWESKFKEKIKEKKEINYLLDVDPEDWNEFSYPENINDLH